MLAKAELLRRNLVLLGYDASIDVENMMEGDILNVLHFCCIQLEPSLEMQTKMLFPLTSITKSNLKKLIQQRLEKLVSQKELPIGSAHMSRLNVSTAHSSLRVVDLLWRMTTITMRELIKKRTHIKDFMASKEENPQNYLKEIQARIALQTRQFQENSIQRAKIQTEWQMYANQLTQAIQNITEFQVWERKLLNCFCLYSHAMEFFSW